MRDDILIAMEAEAESMRAKAAAVRERAKLQSDGSCLIARVNEDVFPPTLAELHTDLGERLPVFTAQPLADAKLAQFDGRRVRFDVRVSEHGTRFVHRVIALPRGDESEYPCVRCGAIATRTDTCGELRSYVCGSCHHLMIVSAKRG